MGQMHRAALVLVLPLALLAGCGGDDEPPASSPSAVPSASAPPAEIPSEATAEPPSFVVATVGSDVVEIDARSGDKRTITSVRGAVPTLVALSADRSTVFFVREYGGFAACDRMEIVSVPRSGGEPRVIADVKGYVGSFAVSRDGRRLAYFNSPGCDAGGQVVVRAVGGGGDEHRIDTAAGPGTVTALAFSPDGGRLALGGVETTVVVDPAAAKTGTDGVALKAPAGQSLVAPQFRADGTLLAASRATSVNATPYTALVPVDPATGEPTGEPIALPEGVDDYDADAAGVNLLALDFPADAQGDYPGARLVRVVGGEAQPLAEGAFDADW